MLRQLSTPEMESEGRGGMTSTYTYGTSTYRAEAEYDLQSNRLQVSTVNGDYVWSSGWLDMCPPWVYKVTEAHIREALKLWQVRVSLLYRGHEKPLTPLELTSSLLNSFEHLLA